VASVLPVHEFEGPEDRRPGRVVHGRGRVAEGVVDPEHVGVREILQRTGLVNLGGELAGGPLSTWAAVVAWQVRSTQPCKSFLLTKWRIGYIFYRERGSRAVDQFNTPPTGVSPSNGAVDELVFPKSNRVFVGCETVSQTKDFLYFSV
jgi:hypothetical protein